MENKLLDLTAVSKKALELGETLCSKAGVLVHDCRADVESIERVHPKLRFLWAELDVQISGVEKLKEYAERQNVALRQYHSIKDQKLCNMLGELDNTLEGLRRKRVDTGIRKTTFATTVEDASASETGVSVKTSERELMEKDEITVKDISDETVGEKATLYDYIEEQNVQELKAKTHEEVASILHFQESNATVLAEVAEHLKRFRGMLNSGNSISLEEAAIEFALEKVAIQERETNVMAETLVALAKHYDQASGALKVIQSSTQANVQLDISVLERDTDELPNIVDELRESLMVIESTSEEVRVRNRIYNQSYAEAVRLFEEIEAFGVKMDEIVALMKSIEGDFEKGRLVVERFMEELWNLIVTYEEFSRAYDHLIVEIDRRHHVRMQHEKVVEDFLSKLEALYIEEAHQRELFSQSHGRYLPMDLCPPIMEHPIRYDVIAQNTTRLPLLSSNVVAEAQANLLGE